MIHNKANDPSLIIAVFFAEVDDDISDHSFGRKAKLILGRYLDTAR